MIYQKSVFSINDIKETTRLFPFCILTRRRAMFTLFLQGDRANGMYFVETGTLVVLKNIDGDEKEVKIFCVFSSLL